MRNDNNRAVIDSLQSLSFEQNKEYNSAHAAIFLIGANGSGKSSLRHYLDLSNITTNIDPDDLKLKNGGNHNLAARQAIDYCAMAIKYRSNFCRESTLSGKTILEAIKKAKAAGYYVIGYFVGLDSVELNIDRIKNRVARGGHYIEDSLVKKRYSESLSNLADIFDQFDELHVLDNSGSCFSPQFSVLRGTLFDKPQLNSLVVANLQVSKLMQYLDKVVFFKQIIRFFIHSGFIIVSIALPVSLTYLTVELWREILVHGRYYCSSMHHIAIQCTRTEAIIDKSFSLIFFPIIVIGFWAVHYGYVTYRLRKKKIVNNLKEPMQDWASGLLVKIKEKLSNRSLS
jgi:predicted ABC-type ATPase